MRLRHLPLKRSLGLLVIHVSSYHVPTHLDGIWLGLIDDLGIHRRKRVIIVAARRCEATVAVDLQLGRSN